MALSIGSLARAQTPPARTDYTTAELLVDLARDYGLNQQGKQNDADVQYVRTLFKAAVRLDPKQTAAYVWLYELAVLENDNQGAAAILRDLLAVDPTHITAFEAWLAEGLAAQQTVEKRQEWLQSVLDAADRPPITAAIVHLELARLAMTRLDRVEARAQLDQVLRFDRWNAEALLLGYNLVEPSAPPEARLRAALKAVQANPLDVQLAWETGELLDECGAARDAGLFFEHALAMQRQLWPNVPVAGARLLEIAQNLAARDDLPGATKSAQQAMEDRESAAQAGIYLHWLLQRQERGPEAGAVRDKLAQRFAAIHETEPVPADELAQAAWFYCLIDKQPQRALLLAEAAQKKAPHNTFAARVLGFAQAMNQRNDQARETLQSIAAADGLAAARLGLLLREAGDDEGMRRVLAKMPSSPPSGPGSEILAELPELAAASQPAASRPSSIADVLAGFDRRSLEFFNQRDRFIEAVATVESRSVAAGEPWLVTFTLTNRGPFPISLGPDDMINPVFLVSMQIEGDKTRSFPNLLTISVDHDRTLPPGGSVQVRRSIDVGPVRLAARQAPQQLQRVTVSALLDAERMGEDQWKTTARGIAVKPLYFNRLPVPVGAESLRSLVGALNGSSDQDRFRAVQTMAQLMGEAQRATLGKLTYQPESVPLDRIDAALRTALASESWELRVRTLEALQVVGLDANLIQAARDCLSHPHWLVRLMATRLIARQGPAARDVIAQVAQADADELVKAFAGSIVRKWRAPASQPTAAP